VKSACRKMACGGGWADGKRRKARIGPENGGIPGPPAGEIDLVCCPAAVLARGSLPTRPAAPLLTNGKSNITAWSKTPAC